jgi:hypothetical protein
MWSQGDTFNVVQQRELAYSNGHVHGVRAGKQERRHPDLHYGSLVLARQLAVRVLRNPVARGSFSAVTLGSGRRLANALWTDAECPSDRCQRWKDASCRNVLHTASREPNVAGCDVENAVPFLADQARLGLFSIGDLVLMFGGILIVAVCLHRTLQMKGSLSCKRLGWTFREMTGHVT